ARILLCRHLSQTRRWRGRMLCLPRRRLRFRFVMEQMETHRERCYPPWQPDQPMPRTRRATAKRSTARRFSFLISLMQLSAPPCGLHFVSRVQDPVRIRARKIAHEGPDIMRIHRIGERTTDKLAIRVVHDGGSIRRDTHGDPTNPAVIISIDNPRFFYPDEAVFQHFAILLAR